MIKKIMNIKNLNFAVVGSGSIGLRHTKNLKHLGATKISVFDPDKKRKPFVEELGFNFVTKFEDLRDQNIDIALICTPPYLHLTYLDKLMSFNANVFIEKPLSHSYEQAKKLYKRIKNYPKFITIGFNWRFHESMIKVKELLNNGYIGKPLIGIFESGQYLANWRPTTDYRKGYFAKKETGGGIISDGCHEIDIATWLLGSPSSIISIKSKVSDLEIETEDTAIILLETESNKLIEIHLNAVEKGYARNSKIIGENGTITWDFLEGVKISSDEMNETYKLTPDTNEMYVDELRNFINNVIKSKSPSISYERGLEIQKIIYSAHLSAEKGKKILM